MRRKRRTTPTPLYVLDLDAIRAVLRQRALSRQWWLFVTLDQTGVNFVQRVAREHFTGKRARDFELMAIPARCTGLGILGVCFARKSKLTRRQLGRLLDQHNMPREAEELASGSKDVIALVPDRERGERAALFLNHLVMGP
jgi:hypothetical protein